MNQSKNSWLSPGAALNRFSPDENIQQAGLSYKQVRYGFKISNIGLIIAAHTISELVTQMPIFPIPNTSNWLLGLINVRGNLIPVYSLKILLALEETTECKQPLLLILDSGDLSVAIAIDTMPQMVETNNLLSHVPPLPSALKEYTTLAYGDGDGIWLEFNHQLFFESLQNKQIL